MEQFLGIPIVMVGARMTTSKCIEKEVSVAAGSNTEVAQPKQGAMPPVFAIPFESSCGLAFKWDIHLSLIHI